MPYISPRRNDSLVHYESVVDVAAAQAYLEKLNVDRPRERRVTLFHLYLRAVANALHDRPGINRFVAGGKLWQRDGAWITYSAKQEILDGSPVLTVKRAFPREEGLLEMVDSFSEELLARRAGRLSTADKEVNLALQVPGFLIRLGIALIGWANHLGIMPRQMIENDPMFSSIFIANLGSVGLDAGYHHVWEYGTCSIFSVLGRVHEDHAGRPVANIKYTYDERIEDGLYAAITLNGIREALEAPESLS